MACVGATATASGVDGIDASDVSDDVAVARPTTCAAGFCSHDDGMLMSDWAGDGARTGGAGWFGRTVRTDESVSVSAALGCWILDRRTTSTE